MKFSYLAKIGGLLLVAIISLWMIIPWVVSDVQSNGTVNARLITVQSPISGQIVKTPPDVGEVVWEGTSITEISDDNSSLGVVASLDVDREMLRSRVLALKSKHEELSKIRERLADQTLSHKNEYATNLRFQAIEANARVKYWESVHLERKQSLERSQKLVKDGFVSASRVEQAQSLFDQSLREIERSRAESDRLQQETEAAEKGVYLREGRNDVPYSQQRLDEVSIALADLTVQIAESQGRLKALERRYEDEMNRAGKREKLVVRAPVTGAVWRRFVISQAFVQQGNEIIKILDCSKLIAEVPVSESSSDKLALGKEINVRFQGGSRNYKGRIIELRGTRSVTSNIEYAAAPPLLKKDEALLTIQITDQSLERNAEKFCHVGRRVEVKLPGMFSFSGNEKNTK